MEVVDDAVKTGRAPTRRRGLGNVGAAQRPGVDLRDHRCKPINERTTGGLDWSNALLDGCGAVELDRHVNDTGLLSATR